MFISNIAFLKKTTYVNGEQRRDIKNKTANLVVYYQH
jgi:hypothetical protein